MNSDVSSRPLDGRFIVLGITGSIAAYKAPEIVRGLRAAGAEVQALLTPAATRFVSPLTLRTLTGRAVDADLLDLLPDGRIGHVVAADSADAILVAPATAQWLGAMAGGLAGDPVTAACLATGAPVIVAPAIVPVVARDRFPVATPVTDSEKVTVNVAVAAK